MRQCLFCGGRVTSKEHVWPLWLLRALGVDTRRTRIHLERGTRPVATWSGVDLAVDIKYVCERCNNRWMSALETRAQPVLLSLIRGTASVLKPIAQAAVATWAVKTAMVFEGTRVEGVRFYSDDDRKIVRQHARPPARTSVWIAKFSGDFVAFSHAIDLFGSLETGDRMQVHVTTLAFGQLAIQVCSGKMPDDVPLEAVIDVDMAPGPWRDATVRVWPASAEEVHWPPAVQLQDAGPASLDAFSDRWGPIER
jgi:hypothetical protein